VNQRQLLTSSLKISEGEELAGLVPTIRTERDCSLEFPPERQQNFPFIASWYFVALGGLR
jgi:hypothetical protein